MNRGILIVVGATALAGGCAMRTGEIVIEKPDSSGAVSATERASDTSTAAALSSTGVDSETLARQYRAWVDERSAQSVAPHPLALGEGIPDATPGHLARAAQAVERTRPVTRRRILADQAPRDGP